MKTALSTSTSLSSHLSNPKQAENHHLPDDMNPLLQCPTRMLNDYLTCPTKGCAKMFTVRHGVHAVGAFDLQASYYSGAVLFCSLGCMLQSVFSHGGDGFTREFRDETKTLH